jgi:hypothetical protein
MAVGLPYIPWNRTPQKTRTVASAHCCLSSCYQVTSTSQACRIHVTILKLDLEAIGWEVVDWSHLALVSAEFFLPSVRPSYSLTQFYINFILDFKKDNPPKCWILCYHSGGYEEFYLLGYNVLQSDESQPTLLLPACLLLVYYLPYSSEERGGVFPWNVS